MIDLAPIHQAAVALGSRAVAERLGFRLGRGNRGACPIHGGQNPTSFGLDVRGGMLVGSCHSCGWGGDVISLVGAMEGLDRFGDVVRRAAEILGVDFEERSDVHQAPPPPEPPRPYPDAGEVASVWLSCPAGEYSPEATSYLEGRGFDVQTLRELDVVRELPAGVRLPVWARIRGRSWWEAGYRLVTACHDCHGVMRSVRAWRTISDGEDLPKRLAPSGKRVSGLVLANHRAVLLLRVPEYLVDLGDPITVRVCEGEPSMLALCSAFRADPVLAVTSATAWPDEVGERIPSGARVIVYPDGDAAGAKLIDAVAASMGARCAIEIANWETAA